MRLAVMYIWVSRDVGHMVDSGSRSVSTVRDLVILPLSVPRKTKPQSVPTVLVIIKLQAALISLIQNVLIALLVLHLVCLAALSPDCPMVALQRNMIIEGTDLVSSKNL